MAMGRQVDSKAIIRKTAIYYLTQLTFNILIGALRETVKGKVGASTESTGDKQYFPWDKRRLKAL